MAVASPEGVTSPMGGDVTSPIHSDRPVGL